MKAFILAAGKGTRLRPHTNDRPKPMVKINDRPLLSYLLDGLKQGGCNHTVINTSYLADIISGYAAKYEGMKISISHEQSPLDTGGGIMYALENFRDEKDFIAINGDSFFEDVHQAIKTIKNAWDPNNMDILIMLQDISHMSLTQGIGDYDIDQNGRAVRAIDKTGKYMFTSLRINKTGVFAPYKKGDEFSYLEILDKAEKQGRLFAVKTPVPWHHISTPDDLENVRAYVKGNQ